MKCVALVFNSSVLTTGYMYVHVVDDFLQASMYLLVEMKKFYFEGVHNHLWSASGAGVDAEEDVATFWPALTCSRILEWDFEWTGLHLCIIIQQVQRCRPAVISLLGSRKWSQCSCTRFVLFRDHLPEFTSAVAAAEQDEKQRGEKRSATSYIRLLFQSLERLLEPSNPATRQVHSLACMYFNYWHAICDCSPSLPRLFLITFQLSWRHFFLKTGKRSSCLSSQSFVKSV